VSDEPRPIGNGLDRIMRSLRGTSAASQVGVFAGWAEAVGPVVGAAAATQLRYLEHQILEQLRMRVGPDVVGRISVRVRR
jgi:hypothetical protein